MGWGGLERGGEPVQPNGEAVRISSLTNSTLELGLPCPPRLTIIGGPVGPDTFSNVALISSKFVSEVSCMASLLRCGKAVVEGERVQRRRLNRWKACDCGRLACNKTFWRAWLFVGEKRRDKPWGK